MANDIKQKNDTSKTKNVLVAPTFFENVARIIEAARRYVGRTADLTMCVTYFEVGRMIVEEEQGGKARAEYGKGLLAGLSEYLNGRVGKGFSESTLKNARKFYKIYAPSIRQTMFAEFDDDPKNQKQQALLTKFDDDPENPIRQAMLAESQKSLSLLDILENKSSFEKNQAMVSQLYPFSLSWSHYLILIRIKNDSERRFEASRLGANADVCQLF